MNVQGLSEHTIYRNTNTVISMENFLMKMATPNRPNTINQFTKLEILIKCRKSDAKCTFQS